MLAEAAAERYADALFQLATEQGKRAEVEEELTVAGALFQAKPELAHALEAPDVPLGVKHNIVGRVFAAGFSTLLSNFLHLLVDRQRIGLLAPIAEVFHRLRDEAENRVDVEVTVAMELPPDLQLAVKARLTEATGRTVELKWRVDPEIVGGIVVRLKDSLIDYSLRTQLQELRERLVRVHV